MTSWQLLICFLNAIGQTWWEVKGTDSIAGANASAVVYTMVEMAKAHDLNIYEYLKFLLEHCPTKEMPDEELAELAPWSEKLQSIKNRIWIIVNYSNSQKAEVILYLDAVLFGAYFTADLLFEDKDIKKISIDEDMDYFNMCRTLCTTPELMSFKLFSLMKRGHSFNMPMALDSKFLAK